MHPRASRRAGRRRGRPRACTRPAPARARRDLRRHASAAEHLRLADDRPRAPALARGHARALAPDARVRHAVAARLRPCGDLDLGGDRADTREGGKSQRDLGREGFDAYVQDWLTRYGGDDHVAVPPGRRSLDYARTRFTMDEDYYRAVIRWFVHLYDRGWIYRANRISNWCPLDRTALSDLELEPRRSTTRSSHPLPAR